MNDTSNKNEFEKYVVGIGLGPSNLALAITAFENYGESKCKEWLFLEQNERCVWHPKMMIEGTKLQISFLKDLVSPFTSHVGE